eukprot:678520-Pyramimonas_sp.AAC.1
MLPVGGPRQKPLRAQCDRGPRRQQLAKRGAGPCNVEATREASALAPSDTQHFPPGNPFQITYARLRTH